MPVPQMSITVVRSSRGRAWRGCEAFLYDATAGYYEYFTANHTVCMHVSAPSPVTIRCDGASAEQLQTPGDVKVIPAGYSCAWETPDPSAKLAVELTPAFVNEVAADMGLDPRRFTIAPQLHLADKRIAHIMWAVATELEAEHPAGTLYAESLTTALAAQLLRHYARAAGHRTAGLPRRRLERVVEYVKENIGQDLVLGELAAVANVSQSHFKVLFKQSMGIPVHQYVIRARVEHAVDLILKTSLPLSEIAFRSGFANQSHLARCVRQLHGTTPAELRRQAL
ncbi:MAG: helix-turn-helix transcriptional regulator [Candidatus Eremiobacteraeota bacterium]|nr:helix-turn-helix transcriptional regulator [Candidatus Eremiobacteraeota bacterium]